MRRIPLFLTFSVLLLSVAAANGRTGAKPALEPKAIEILKAASARLAAAHSMSFTADVSYESPTRQGPPLVYVTQSNVTMVRPNKLRVITPGDGPASEFYYETSSTHYQGADGGYSTHTNEYGAASATYAMGQTVAVIPVGCTSPTLQGQVYYLCGNTWFSPAYGANGLYYRVVPVP